VLVASSVLRGVTCRYVSLGDVLQVESVSSGDEGTYRCVASNDARHRTSNDAQLSLLVTNTQPPGQSLGHIGGYLSSLARDGLVPGRGGSSVGLGGVVCRRGLVLGA